jgi:hypothetical protein
VPDAAEQFELVLLEAHARPPAVAEPAPRELGRDVVDQDGKAGGHPFDRDHEGRTVGLTRRQEAQHGVLRSDVRLTGMLCERREAAIAGGGRRRRAGRASAPDPEGRSRRSVGQGEHATCDRGGQLVAAADR